MNRRVPIFLTLLIILVLINASCKKDEPVDENSHPLYGKWEWVSSFGGIAGQKITPASEGYTVTVEFAQANQYFYYKNDTLTRTDTYTIKETENSNMFDYIIEYGSSQSYPDQYMDFPYPDTLRLIDNCFDCYDNVYVRK